MMPSPVVLQHPSSWNKPSSLSKRWIGRASILSIYIGQIVRYRSKRHWNRSSFCTKREGSAAGLSNFTAEEVKIICELATERGWLRPSVYQGLYNALNRGAETGLLPTLREQSISFYAYNPLAGGLLSGRHDLRNLKSTEGRFKNNDFYYARYGKEDIFRALADLSVACEHHSVGMADASLRWMVHHSSLAAQAGDRLILGCSSVEQLQQNLASCVDQPKLPLELVNAFEYAWDVSKHSSASFASYGTSGSMLQTEVTAVGLQDSGDEVLVNFHDGQRCSFLANWLLDASPDNVSESFTRLDSEIVRRRAGVNAVDASQSADATSVDVTFSDGAIIFFERIGFGHSHHSFRKIEVLLRPWYHERLAVSPCPMSCLLRSAICGIRLRM